MASIGIIGGADGPTAIYLTGGDNMDFGLFGDHMEFGNMPVYTDGSEMMWNVFKEVFIGPFGIAFLAMMIIAYFIGNISPSITMAKKKGLDIKKEGSGNAGTTNALRVMGKKAGAITLLIDVLKGVVSVLLGDLVCGPYCAMFCVVAVMLGHIWPAVYKFKGGKGVATAFGALLGLNPLLGLVALGVVAVGLLISKRMSVGSIVGALSFPALCYFLEPDFIFLGSVLAILILIKHRANIVRLFKGEEPKLSIFDKEKEK